MELTDTQRNKINSLLDKGLSSRDIADKVGVTVQQVAAIKAWRTINDNQGDKLSNSDSKNYRYFKVQGEYIVRATSKQNAVLATQRANLSGTTVLSGEVDAERITREVALSSSES